MVQQDGLIGLVAEACAIALAIGSLVHIKLQNGTTKRTLYQVRATPSGHVRWKGASWTDVEPLEGSRLLLAILNQLGLTSLVAVTIANQLQGDNSEQWSISITIEVAIAILLLAVWTLRFIPCPHRNTLYLLALFLDTVIAIVHFPTGLFYMDADIGDILSRRLQLAQSIIPWIVLVMISLTPRVYVPIDPYDSDSRPSFEQEASFASYVITFSWLNKLIIRAWKTELEAEDLPIVPDRDTVETWTKKLPAHEDGSGYSVSRLLVAFNQSLISMWVCEVINAASFLIKPIVLRSLLEFLEDSNDRKEPMFAPWVYVSVFGLSIYTECISKNGLFFWANRVSCQLQGATIQALFSKTLALRLSGSGKESEVTSREAEKNVSSSSARIGQINNLMSSDIRAFQSARNCWQLFGSLPLIIIGALILLHNVIGWIAYVGAAMIFALCILVQQLIKISVSYQKDLRAAADTRVGATSEILNSVRMIKYFGWEELAAEKLIAPKREAELQAAFKRNFIEVWIRACYTILPLTNLLVAFTLYTNIMKKPITPSVAYSVIVYFKVIQTQFDKFIDHSTYAANFYVSWRRVLNFLADEDTVNSTEQDTDSEVLAYRDAQLSWNVRSGGEEDKTCLNHDDGVETDVLVSHNGDGYGTTKDGGPLLKDIDIEFPPGTLTVITGALASGKTSLLLGLLGELILHKGTVLLPRHSGVSYVPQVAWLLNATIKDNILFGCNKPYDDKRYKEALFACGLEPDLANFAAGDLTEVGEKGLTLSGGQRQRVSLARAIYAFSQIVLLDDTFSALDATTAKHVYENVICGSLLAGRTVLLVTHQVSLVAKSADRIIRMSHGRIESVTSGSNAAKQSLTSLTSNGINERGAFAVASTKSNLIDDINDDNKEIETQHDQQKQSETVINNGKLIMAEERAHGRVSKRHLFGYLSYMGAPVLSLIALFSIIAVAFRVFGPLSIGLIDDSPHTASHKSLDMTYFVTFYLGVLIATITSSILYDGLTMYGRQIVSRKIHDTMLHAVLNAPLRFFDTTPIGRVLNRFSNDLIIVDQSLPDLLRSLWEYIIDIGLSITAVITLLPSMLAVSLVVVGLMTIIAEMYIRAQVSVRRIMSIAASFMMTSFNDGLSGSVIIRAFGNQPFFLRDNMQKVNQYIRAAKTNANLNRWLGHWLGVCQTIMPLAAGFLALASDLTPRFIGFCLTAMLSFGAILIELVRTFNNVEVDLNAVERINYYIDNIDQEEEATDAFEPPASWPATGRLEVCHLSVRYSPTGPKVLDDLSFDILPGERVGVVGVTGSGKSSLALSLLRLTNISGGSIYLDGRDIMRTNLHTLRRRVTFIPQDPACLHGTVRSNLDPFDELEDADLNAALIASGITDCDTDIGSSHASITLDTRVSHGGGNLSQGQRQLLAFARALVRRSKLIILDEATSYTDAVTDAKIQETIGTSFQQCSILTIAHRLRTIVSFDRIMVLGNPEGKGGRVIEFDTPLALLERKHGALATFAVDSGEFEELVGLAKGME